MSAPIPPTITPPRSFQILKALHIPTIILGTLLWLVILLTSLNSLTKGYSDAQNILSTFRILAALLGFTIVALQCMSLFRMLKKHPSFRFWTITYALSSIAAKVIILIGSLIYIAIFRRLASDEIAKQDIFSQAFHSDQYNQSINETTSGILTVVMLLLIFGSIYPSIVLLLCNRKSMKSFKETLSPIS